MPDSETQVWICAECDYGLQSDGNYEKCVVCIEEHLEWKRDRKTRVVKEQLNDLIIQLYHADTPKKSKAIEKKIKAVQLKIKELL